MGLLVVKNLDCIFQLMLPFSSNVFSHRKRRVCIFYRKTDLVLIVVDVGLVVTVMLATGPAHPGPAATAALTGLPGLHHSHRGSDPPAIRKLQ